MRVWNATATRPAFVDDDGVSHDAENLEGQIVADTEEEALAELAHERVFGDLEATVTEVTP